MTHYAIGIFIIMFAVLLAIGYGKTAGVLLVLGLWIVLGIAAFHHSGDLAQQYKDDDPK